MTVHEAWNDVMRDVREIRKTEKNSKQNYVFRGVDAVMNAVGPIFREHGVSCVPINVEARHRDFTSGSDKLVHEAIVIVTYRVTGPDGDYFDGMSIGESADWSDKATAQAMSVALRTFLLQGLTMPTDDPEPDQVTVDRAKPDPAITLGWETSDKQAEAWGKLTDRAKNLHSEDAKAELRAWLKDNNLKPKTITKDEANAFHALLKTYEDAAPAADGDPVKDAGWKSKAERTRTMNSLMERIKALPAFESETISDEMENLGITGDMEDLTKDQSVELLALIVEAEELAAGGV